jgi:hypothetical protein
MRAGRARFLALAALAAALVAALVAMRRPTATTDDGGVTREGESPGPPLPAALAGRAAAPEATADAAATAPAPEASGAAGGVEGTVTLWDGAPGADVEVWLVPADEPAPPRSEMARIWEVDDNPRGLPSGRTDAEGKFFLPLPTKARRLDATWAAVARLAMSAEARSEPTPLPAAGERIRRDVRVPEPGRLRVSLPRAHDPPLVLRQLGVETHLLWEWIKIGEEEVPEAWALREEPPESGQFVLRLLPGSYKVRAWWDSTPLVEGEIEVPAGREVEWVPRLVTDGVVRGRVTTSDGRPPWRAHVSWDGAVGAMVEADAEGRFALRGVGKTPGTLSVHATAHELGRMHLRREGVVPDGPDLDLVLRRPPRVRALVAGLPAGTRLRTLEISRGLTGGSHPGIDADGNLRLAGQFEEPSLLVLRIPDRAPRIVAVGPLEPETETDLGTITFDEGVVLSGRVVDEKGVPVEGAEVAIADRWAAETGVPAVTTPADGTFRFERMPPVPVHVRVRGAGRPQHVKRVDPQRDAPAEVVVTHGGKVDIEVIDPDGGSMGDVRVVVRLAEDLPYDADADSTRRHVPIGPDGKRTVMMCAGPRRLRAHAPDGRRSPDVLVTVREGETISARLVLAPPAR